MSNQPSRFSIVTPSFNQLDWLRLCVASVRDQIADVNAGMRSSKYGMGNGGPESRHDFSVEHIIQDAGSPGIADFAREIGADFYRDGQLVFSRGSHHPESSPPAQSISPISHGPFQIPNYSLSVYSERDEGMYDAINRGLSKTSGGICAWLNSDEQYLEGTLVKVARLLQEEPDIDVLLGDVILLDREMRPVSYRRIMVPSRWHTRLDHLHSLSCAMFFRRAALPSPPLDTRWMVIGDAVLMEHFLSSGKRIKACGQPFAAYAFTGSNLSSDPSHGEHARWNEDGKAPPRIMKVPVIWLHRFRRLVHKAYGRFRVRAAIYSSGSRGRRAPMEALVPGTWPC